MPQMQQPGQPATVSAAAEATGGINAGNFIETAIDDELFRFNSDDTPLMQLMLKAKRVKVDSPEVDHYMIDEPVSEFLTADKLEGDTRTLAPLPLEAKDQNVARGHTTLLVPGVDGYDASGAVKTPGKPLMLFVTGQDPSTNNPVVRAVNGPKTNPSDEECLIPEIPKGERVVILANSLYETQKEVDPDLVVPQATRIFLQKRGMNQVVSDYFDSQRKRIPFSKAVIAEQAIANFKVRGNRTLWAGRQSKFKLSVPRMGLQYVYTTEGVRWQFRKELHQTSPWTVKSVIAMAKMFFTGEDVPKKALLLAGKNFLEQLQTIDYSQHPEVQLVTRTNSVGWVVTSIHTVFGDIDIKREPTLDRLGWSNSGALIGEDRLVHYIYSAEHSFSDRMEGEEATRSGILIWDALALKGSCHIWIDGEGQTSLSTVASYKFWNSDKAPDSNESLNQSYYLLCNCPGIAGDAMAGQVWRRIELKDVMGTTLVWQREQ